VGSIRPRKDTGKLFIDFRYQGIRCREQTLLNDNAVNRRRLEKLLSKIEREISLGIFDYTKTFPNSSRSKTFELLSQHLSGIPFLKEFAGEWFKENAFRWKKSGIVNTRNIIDKHLLPAFGEMPVNAISKGDILKFRATLAERPGRKGKRLSPKRINNILVPLKSILNEAAERFDFPSPFRNIKALKVGKADIQPFTLVEVNQILKHVRCDYRNYFIVRFFTGMRSGEIHGLRWRNIDFERGLIYVVDSYTYGAMQDTKTDGSDRDIQICDTVLQALLEQRKVTASISEFVFCNRNGRQIDNANVTKRVWYPLLHYLELKPRRPYQTRHTAASLWLAAGENPEWVARQLGHTSTQMLFQTYSRYIPNATRQDGSAFESLIHNFLIKEEHDEK